MLDQETAARLLRDAHAAAARAYVPYSRFPVGAALLTTDGTTSTGCNIENASYGLTVCAERVAVFNAVANGARAVVAIAVVAADIDGVTPCGACRQVLSEFAPGLRIDGVGPRSSVSWTISELLPAAFGPEQLR